MLTREDIKGWIRETDEDNLARCMAAVNAYVGTLPCTAGRKEWTADVKLGATMLLARLLRRRNSPNGIEAATDANLTYIARYDSDIARLLQLDGFQKPQIG